MKMLIAIGTTTAIALVFSLSPTALVAQDGGQDCGWNCNSCGEDRHEGENYNPGGGNHMKCNHNSEGCSECGGANLTNIDGIQDEMIALVIDAADASELATILDGYGARLVYSAERAFVAVVGADCDADAAAISQVVFLSPEKAEVVARHSSVRNAEDFAGFSPGLVLGT